MKWLVLLAATGCGFAPAGGGPVDAARDGQRDGDGDGPMAIDAAIDAPPDAPKMWTMVESMTVPCLNSPQVSATVLAAGVEYHLRASGECTVNTTSGSRSDADFIGYNLQATPIDVYLNVDYGIAVDDLSEGSTKLPHWGPYSSTHAYEVSWTGSGAPITAEYHDADNGNNTGSLTFEIWAYQ